MQRKIGLTFLLFSLLTAMIFAFSWTQKILFTDEIIYEELSYQMYRTGDYLIPKQEGVVWLQRSPLYFWVTAAIYQFAPPTPFTRRLVTLIAAAGTVAITYRLALRFSSKKAARWAMILLTTSPLFFFFTKTANLDIPAAFFIGVTLLSYMKAKTRPTWLLIAALTFGLGILARSFLALTPLPVMLIDQIMEKRRRIRPAHLLSALVVAVAVFLPWHLAVFLEHPQQFTQEYLSFNVNQHFFSQTPGHEPLSAVRFLFHVLVKFNPLAALILGNVLPGSRRRKPIPRLLLLWTATSLLPLTLAATRHEWYAIQVLPPIAILAGQGLVRLEKELDNHLAKPRQELVKVFSLSVLAALPATVFLNMPKETKSVTTLRQFMSQTPEGTPLYNFQNRYTPHSTLFNPREVEIVQPENLSEIRKPLYLYIDNQTQFDLVQSQLRDCCQFEVTAKDRRAKILRISRK